MNLLASWKHQPTDASAYLGDPLDLDADFEEACRKEVQGLTRAPMQTPVERLKEATEKIVTVLRDRDTAHDKRIAELSQQLADEEKAKADNLAEIATVERALAELGYDAAEDARRSYDLAVQVKRERGDTTWPVRASEEAAQPSKAKSRKAREVA